MSTSLSGRSSVATTNPSRQQLDELDALLQRMLDLPVHQAGDGLAAEESSEAMARSGDATTGEDRATPGDPAGEEPFTPDGLGDLPASFYTVTEVVSAPLSMTSSYRKSGGEGAKQKVDSSRDVPLGHEEHRELDVTFAAGSSPAPTEAAREETDKDEAWVPFRSSWQPSPQTWLPLAESWQQGRTVRETRADPNPTAKADSEQPRAVELTSPAPTVKPAAEPVVPSPAAKESGASAKAAPSPSCGENVERLSWKFWPLLLVNGLFDVLTLPLGPLGSALRSRWGRAFLGAVGMLCLAAAGAWCILDYLGLDLLALLR
jgi:hypothetical protein